MNPVDHPMGGGEGKSSGGHLDHLEVKWPKVRRQEILRRFRLNTSFVEEKLRNNK